MFRSIRLHRFTSRSKYVYILLAWITGVTLIIILKFYSHLFAPTRAWLSGADDDAMPLLRSLPQEVPVVIVDEHQQVIPYWYKGAEEEILRSKGNTLIHIDGHSDMATAGDADSLMSFKRKALSSRSAFLPLMDSNDVFILSAIFEGLINKVVWVRPSWSNNSEAVLLESCYVGFVLPNDTESVIEEGRLYSNRVCSCCQDRVEKQDVQGLSCQYDYGEEIRIPVDACEKVRAYTYIVIGENDVRTALMLHKVKSAIVDIDEDFFGVESGVGQFIELGVSETTQRHMDDVLGLIYCPESVSHEESLDGIVRLFFTHIASIKGREMDNNKSYLEEKLIAQTSAYFCKGGYLTETFERRKNIKAFVNFLYSLSKDDTLGLSKVRYCLSTSPNLKSTSMKFGICHGYNFPADTLNQIYVGNKSEIIKRGESVRDILEFISANTELRLVTIARSLRDGYTPRQQQRFIERTLVEKLEDVIEKSGKSVRLLYDKANVFGKRGW